MPAQHDPLALLQTPVAQALLQSTPTVCLSHDSSRVLFYQELPTSVQCGKAIPRR
jgi:hypothetical protein